MGYETEAYGQPANYGMTWSSGSGATNESGTGDAIPQKYGRKKTGGVEIPLGGWGRKDPGRFARADWEYQKKLREDIWKKTTPTVEGVGFMTNWTQNKDGTWVHKAELGEKEQSIYDDAYTRQNMFLDQATRMGSGGWEDMQQQRFDQKRALYSESDALAQQQRLAREQATGASSTGMFLGERTEQQNINRRNQILEEEAFKESQGLIDSNLRRGKDTVGMMGDVSNWANKYLQIPESDPKGNLGAVSTSHRTLQNVLAGYAEESAKGKSDFWKSILGGISGGIF